MPLEATWLCIGTKSVNFQVPTPPRQPPQIGLSGETMGGICEHKQDKDSHLPRNTYISPPVDLAGFFDCLAPGY